MRLYRRPHIDLTVLVCLVAPICGCGGSDQMECAQVTGSVTLDGEPLPTATILFRPDFGRAGRGKIENGIIVESSTYGINDGIVLGKHRIAVQAIPEVVPVTGSRIEEPVGSGRTIQPPPSYAPSRSKARTNTVVIPKKYQDPEQSGLTAEITADGNELNLQLMKQ